MEKLEYILNQFHRTWNKKWENYCIERIYNKLDNPNLQFVTQQMFRRRNNSIALADLYFPQLKISVEIDEEYHKGNVEKDQERTKEILDRMNQFETIVPFEPEELRIEAGVDITLENINDQIDKIVKIITQRISLLPELKWDSVFRKPEDYIQDGYVSAENNASFQTLWDVSKLFAKGYKKGCQLSWFDAVHGACSVKVWCPKVSVNVEGYKVKVPYDNEISVDSEMIYESAKENNNTFVEEYLSEPKSKEIRYVFPYYKTAAGIPAYVFKGVYALDIIESRRMNKRVWKRVSKSIDLSKYHTNPVNQE